MLYQANSLRVSGRAGQYLVSLMSIVHGYWRGRAACFFSTSIIYSRDLALDCGMKVLLKQLRTGWFLKSQDQWTADSAEALDFKTAPSAMDYSRIHGYQDTSIILKFVEQSDDLELKNCC
jgi:hypothetical protein